MCISMAYTWVTTSIVCRSSWDTKFCSPFTIWKVSLLLLAGLDIKDLAIPLPVEANDVAGFVSGTHKRPESWRLRALWRCCVNGLDFKFGMLRLGVVGDKEMQEVGAGRIYDEKFNTDQFEVFNKSLHKLVSLHYKAIDWVTINR